MATLPETLRLQPDVLRWARQRADLTPDQLAHKVRLKADRVLEWERSGEISMDWVEKLAAATHSPLGYLFLSFPPFETLPITDFRTRAGDTPLDPSLEMLETIYAMQQRSDWLREELIDIGAEPVQLVGAFRPRDQQCRCCLCYAQRIGTYHRLGGFSPQLVGCS